MKLVIAEKPNMAAEIANCIIPEHRKQKGYFQGNGTAITWLYGHILRQAEPDEYDVKYKVWRAEDLPIIPYNWKLRVTDSCAAQYQVVKQLLDTATEIIHAGDPDREGQLLVDEVLNHLGVKKPVKRVLVNALDERSIKNSFASLRDNRDFNALYQAALGRARADWLTGMNLSRAYTLAAKKAGHSTTLSIGRVKTPTLALVVRRERALKTFKPVDYSVIKAEFKHVNGLFTASWKPKNGQPGLDEEGRLIDAARGQELVKRMQDEKHIPGFLSLYEISEKKEPNILPFSLSALQIKAGKKFNLDPQAVLDTVQELYEAPNLKLVTYPRSDCDYLPESQHSDARIILENLKIAGNDALKAWAQKAQPSMKSRAWNDSKTTAHAHHAIIPTTVRCDFNALTPVQKDIYLLIAQSYIAQFYPIHTYNQAKVEVIYAGEKFTASGKTIKEAGWKELYGREDNEEPAVVLPIMNSGDNADFCKAVAEKKTTKPPSKYTPSTLLAAMKEIHKYVKNPELKNGLKEVSGIGTEATRATIIDELIKKGYLTHEKKQKFLTPTEAAYLMIDLLPDELTYPDSTALWEERLNKISQGRESLDNFLTMQQTFLRVICRDAANAKAVPPKQQAACPGCKTGVLLLRKGKHGSFWGCSRFPECKTTYDDKKGAPNFEKKNK